MWKKSFVFIISFISIFAVALSIDMNLMASTNKALNSYTGVINQIGYDSSATIGQNFKTGDRISMGLLNPHTNKPLAWQLIKKISYTDYGCTLTTTCPSKPMISSWISLAEESIGKTTAYSDNLNWKPDFTKDFKYSNIYKNYVKPLNTALSASLKDYQIVAPRNLSDEHGEIKYGPDYLVNMVTSSHFSTPDLLGRSMFLYDIYTLIGIQAEIPDRKMNLVTKDTTFKSSYHVANNYNDPIGSNQTNKIWYVRNDGVVLANNNSGSTEIHDIRPTIQLDLEKVVFSLSVGDASGNPGEVSEPYVPVGYSNLHTQAVGSQMKVRVYNDLMNASILDLKNIDGTNLYKNTADYKLLKGKSISVFANGNTEIANSTLAAIIRDDNDKFVMYQSLGAAMGTTSEYNLDLSGLPAGAYSVSVVNEVYEKDSTAPADSSLISSPLSLIIEEPLGISYTPKPQDSMNMYEYSKNVNPGTKVGEIAYQDGVGNPTFTIVNHPTAPSGHSNDFQNFEISASPISSPVDVSIKTTGAPDLVKGSLKAGDYYFRIEAVDANGDPTPAVYQDVKLTVNKTTPTITFTPVIQKDMIVGDTTYIDAIQTSNTDILSITDVSYSLSGGVASVLSVSNDPSDALKYKLDIVSTHSGVGLPAEFNLNATIKETDNFNAFTTSVPRKIYTYKELSALTWSPSKGSFSTTDVNHMNAIIGTLIAVDGVGPYSYEVVSLTDPKYDLEKGADNSSFTVSKIATAAGTSVQVKTTMALTSNTYKIQFKVSDSKGKSVYTNGEIKVSAKGQNAFDFKDKVNGTVITTLGMKVKYDDTSSKLIAEGGSTSAPVEYDFAPADIQPSGVNPASYATINPANGLITPIRIGTIKVQATKLGDATYDAITTYMDLTIEPAPQNIEFNDKSSIINIAEGSTKNVAAVGKITSTGAIGEGGITYTSSDPTIASVDPNTGDVTGMKAGSVNIIATLNATDPSNTEFKSNYDTVNATKAIKVYEPMSIVWTAKIPYIKAEDNKIQDLVGTINVTNNIGAVTYAISTGSTPENTDKSFFSIVGSGTSAQLQLNKLISASDHSNHAGTFKVQVDVSDTNNEIQTIDIVVLVDVATNDIYFTEDGIKINSLTKKYGESGNALNLTSSSSNSGSATYSVAVTDTSGTLSVSGTGAVVINKAGSAMVQVVIGEGGGYEGGTITMPVTITQGDQSIVFKDTATLNRQFVVNSTFQELAELKETSKNITSTRTITYLSNTPDICSIDVAGTVTMHAKGTCDIDATNIEANWKSVTTNKKINLYDGMGASFIQTLNMQAETVSTNVGAKAGSLQVNGGLDPKSYTIATDSNSKNKDSSYFQINSTGVLSFKKAIGAADLVGKYNPTKNVYELYVQLIATDSEHMSVTTDAIIDIKGAPLKASFDTKGTGKITEEYGLNRTFTLDLSSNKGNGLPTYRLKNDSTMPSDVLQSVDESGLVTILHANDKAANANPVMVEAYIPASNGYAEESIEVEVEITKASQPNFAFKTPNIKLGHGASITPSFTGKLSSGTISMESDNKAKADINGSEIVAKLSEGIATITAIESGDRDYKNAIATATIKISSEPAYNFVISVPSVTYGDIGLKASIILNKEDESNILTQTWSSSDPSIAEVDENKNITIHKAGQVTISCTQTSTGDPSVTATATLVVDPKPITVIINNASKYVGERLPVFSAVIPTEDLVGSDTIAQPTFSCKDGSIVVNHETKAGTYEIVGMYSTSEYPNYAISVQNGILSIKQDTSLASWYHLEGDTSKTILDTTKWHNQNVNIVLDIAQGSAGIYDEISLDKTLWDVIHQVSNEGETSSDVFFIIKNTEAIATSQVTTIKIDKSKPIITNITGVETNKDAISTLLNSLSFGAYFKPGINVSIKSEDVLPKPNIKVSGVKTVAYEIYVIDRLTGKVSITPIASGNLSPNASGISEVTMSKAGLYRVCATASDNAGNQGSVSCSDINVKNIGVDIDKDGKPDNLDPDNDGCPDIDIVLKDEEEKFYKINVDRNGDGIPDLNIDSNGKTGGSTPDGKADINIDTDKDGKPDVNLLYITNDLSQGGLSWKPTFCVVDVKEGTALSEYCTMKGLKPLINVDLDGDLVPDINIDTDGDYKADFNISFDGIHPHVNIGILHEWKPDKDGKKDSFIYDTMQIEKEKILINIDTDKDGIPDINIDLNGDLIPDINIDTNGDFIPNINIDSDGDGKADVNIDTNKDGQPDENIIEIKEWKPDKDCDVSGFKYDTMSGITGKDQLEDNDVIVSKPGGIFLPNYALKVDDITSNIDEVVKNDIAKKANGQIIEYIYDVKLIQDGVVVQPDGKLLVKIPLPNQMGNPHLIIQQADGTYSRIKPEIKDGYLVYETEFLGKVAIVQEDKVVQVPDNDDNEEFEPNIGGSKEPPQTSVKGTYSAGSNTGDSSNLSFYLITGLMTSCIIMIILKKIEDKPQD